MASKRKTEKLRSIKKSKTTKKSPKTKVAKIAYSPKHLLKVSSRYTGLDEEEKLVVNLINHFYKKNRIDPVMMPIARDFLLYRAEQLKESKPEIPEGKDYVDTIFAANDIITSTTYFSHRNYTYLVSNTSARLISSEPFIMASMSANVSTGLVIEVIAEIILILTALVTNLPGGSKKAAEEAAETVATNPSVRNIIKELLELFRDWNSKTPRAARESLRDVLSRLFSHLTDALSDFFKKLFESLNWWDILLMIADLIFTFSPVGWLKKWGSFAAGILGLIGSIVAKTA